MTTIIAVIIAILSASMIINLLKSMGKAAPLVFGYGVIYSLSFYIWDWICWILAIVFTLGFLKILWDSANKKHKKGEWM